MIISLRFILVFYKFFPNKDKYFFFAEIGKINET